jgi:hypothetical protein
MKVIWYDAGREPKCAPNPAYPDGVDIDGSEGATATCTAELPYPARRCGHYTVECETCGLSVGVTTAGRPDDPRSIKLACKVAPANKH